MAPDSLTIEITGAEDKIDGLLEVLRPYGVLEMARTGRVAMARGARGSQPQTVEPAIHQEAGGTRKSHVFRVLGLRSDG